MIVVFCKKRVFVDKMFCCCWVLPASCRSFLLQCISFEIPGVVLSSRLIHFLRTVDNDRGN